jgi:hypothetical protein
VKKNYKRLGKIFLFSNYVCFENNIMGKKEIVCCQNNRHFIARDNQVFQKISFFMYKKKGIMN